MSRTITAMFDTKQDAEAGRERLMSARLDADNVRIHDQAAAGQPGQYSTQQDRGMWDSIKNAFLPDEDRHVYEEGVRRGGFLLTADVDDNQADDAVRALEDANSVDIDERADSWRQQGWNYEQPAQQSAPQNLGAQRTVRDGDEERLPVMEEHLVVGKREVERGGVRVRSYVSEVPVHEQVRLRQERVNVERVPVDREVAAGDADTFRERSIEMTETAEEAVVGKTARVVEEVVVSRTSDERVEDINETVRRTDVDVEQIGGDSRADADQSAASRAKSGMTGATGATGDNDAGRGTAPDGLFGTSGQGTGMGGAGAGVDRTDGKSGY